MNAPTLIADCLITFGIGIQTAWLGMPSAILLIKQGDRTGWVGPVAVFAGLACVAAGVVMYHTGAAQ